MKKDLPDPPATFTEFTGRFPDLARAWESIGVAGRQGPLDETTQRLVKLAVAIGAMREGAVHASVRKARAMGIAPDALEQVVALAAGTLGLPASVAVFAWLRDVVAPEP